MRPDPDTCRDPDLLAAEVRRLRAVIAASDHRAVTEMTDVAVRLRQTRANMIGTDDAQHYWDCHDAADEIERLRNTGACPHVRGTVTHYCSLNFALTVEEREAINFATSSLAVFDPLDSDAAAVLRHLLERTMLT